MSRHRYLFAFLDPDRSAFWFYLVTFTFTVLAIHFGVRLTRFECQSQLSAARTSTDSVLVLTARPFQAIPCSLVLP